MPPIHRCLFVVPILSLVLFFTLFHTRPSFTFRTTKGNPHRDPNGKNNAPAPVKHIDTSTSVESTSPGVPAIPGFTVFDRLYLRNGTFYVMTSKPSNFPPKRNILTPPVDIGAGLSMEPTDQELQFIDPQDAKQHLGDNAVMIEGLTWILYDTSQFMGHFYHWWGEIILGAWRVYSSLTWSPDGAVAPPFPARFLLPHIHGPEWRDRAGVNAPLMRACFPSASIEKADYWLDLVYLDKTFVFEHVMIVSREASRRHPSSKKWFKMIAGAMDAPVRELPWEPIRSTVVRNVLGYLPAPHRALSPFNNGGGDSDGGKKRPLVTYVSRQGGGRRLLPGDHEILVRSLLELESDGVCDVVVAWMETMTLGQQVELAARSTIIVGVHGNGLTHQLWMPHTKQSTVIEIFYPKGYVYDYEILARNLGHRHYAVWNDTLITYPKGTYHDGITYGDGFHGNSIPVHGPAVAQVIKERLMAPY